MNLSYMDYWTRVRLHSSNDKIFRHHACSYTIQMNCRGTNFQVDTSMWLIPIVDATLMEISTTSLRSNMEDSQSWCYKYVKKPLRPTICGVNWKLTNNCHRRLCVHYCRISRSMIMDTHSFYGRGSSSVKKSLIYIWIVGRDKPK